MSKLALLGFATTWRRSKDMLEYPVDYFRKYNRPWEKWFAWYPVKVCGRYVWLKAVYRRTVYLRFDIVESRRVEYGTLFDVMKNE